jgi:dipeptidyl aminopeptidase/acylaminoacyl peptidase
VPPNQSITMHAALRAKGLPCALKLYPGEQHGFRQAANIQDALQSELYFFGKVFGFTAAGDVPAFPIDNLD